MFLLITISFVFSILYLRFQKIVKEKKVKKLKDRLGDFINIYLFDESQNIEEIKRFQKQVLKTDFDKKVAIKVLLVYEENFKGATNSMIRDLFFLWGLDHVTEKDLRSGVWYKIARAIYISSELNLEEFHPLIEKYLDSERDEVRQQVILYLINLAEIYPLEFLDKIKTPLTLWEQIYIEECLKTKYSGPTPDFSRWLYSELKSVQMFSMKMISEYNQYENIDKLAAFLESKDLDLKNAAIKNLAQMGYPDLMEYCENTFDNQSPSTKKIMIKVLKRLGDLEDVLRFEDRIPSDDWMNQQVFSKLKLNYVEKSTSLVV